MFKNACVSTSQSLKGQPWSHPCLDTIHQKLTSIPGPVSLPQPHTHTRTHAHTHALQGSSAPPTCLLTALSHQVHLCSSLLTKMTLRVRVQVYTSPPAFSLFSSRSPSAPSVLPPPLLTLFPLLFPPLRSHSSFSLTCSEAPFSNSSLVHKWKCTEAGLGFWVHTELSLHKAAGTRGCDPIIYSVI